MSVLALWGKKSAVKKKKKKNRPKWTLRVSISGGRVSKTGGFFYGKKAPSIREFGKACEDLSWNHCTSTPHRSETNGTAERAVRRVKEGTSAVLLQSGLNESWWADSMEYYTYLRNVTDLLSDGKTPMKDVLGNHLKDLLFQLVHWLSITLELRRISQESINLERKFYLDYSSDTLCTR